MTSQHEQPKTIGQLREGASAIANSLPLVGLEPVIERPPLSPEAQALADRGARHAPEQLVLLEPTTGTSDAPVTSETADWEITEEHRKARGDAQDEIDGTRALLAVATAKNKVRI